MPSLLRQGNFIFLFMVYLTSLPITLTVYRLMTEGELWFGNNTLQSGLGIIWSIISDFGGTEKNHEAPT
jgi:hypothetical protein